MRVSQNAIYTINADQPIRGYSKKLPGRFLRGRPIFKNILDDTVKLKL
jgi:hypothetical protein